MKFAILIAISVALYVLFLFPVGLGWVRALPDEKKADNHLLLIVSATLCYYLEYGKFPEIPENGRVESESANAALMKVLTGEDRQGNPKGYAFIELGKGSKDLRDAKSGAFRDPWGHFYRIRFDQHGRVGMPYVDGPSGRQLDAIAWSVGKDGIQGSEAGADRLQGSDDRISWR